MIGAGNFDLYISSLYWTVSTLGTVGYGDIAAQNIAEMIYSMVAIAMGITVFGYFMGAMAQMLANMTSGDMGLQGFGFMGSVVHAGMSTHWSGGVVGMFCSCSGAVPV